MKKIIAWVVIIIVVVIAGLAIFNHPASAPKHNSSTASSSSSQAASFNKKQYSLTDPASPWVVVNKLRPLNPVDYAPSDLVSAGNGQEMRAEAASQLKKMQAAASAEGLNFYAASGYRSYQTQVAAYTSMVNSGGQAYADSLSARPGYSEHQTGWAVDLGTGSCSIDNCFATTPAGQWVSTNAYKFGFLLRYPKGLQSITGYDWESWHYRYIGVELATELHKTGTLTLEQFFNLPPAPNYK